MKRLQLDEMLTLANRVEEWSTEKRKIYFEGEYQYEYALANVYRGSLDGRISVEVAEAGNPNFPNDIIRIRVYADDVLLGEDFGRKDKRIRKLYDTLKENYSEEELKRNSGLRNARQLISQ